ncbi:CLUMA_CG006118, isoform A [Clunio marinus]|uniref:CLUMA_CG006118, isoform A n=1 Tax=Clunio marinus TaxID=568069 RepID=A0A1J1HX40_9DIPT|nr:CLUMA_CG006118, isoform A [Clunio marinus]
MDSFKANSFIIDISGIEEINWSDSIENIESSNEETSPIKEERLAFLQLLHDFEREMLEAKANGRYISDVSDTSSEMESTMSAFIDITGIDSDINSPVYEERTESLRIKVRIDRTSDWNSTASCEHCSHQHLQNCCLYVNDTQEDLEEYAAFKHEIDQPYYVMTENENFDLEIGSSTPPFFPCFSRALNDIPESDNQRNLQQDYQQVQHCFYQVPNMVPAYVPLPHFHAPTPIYMNCYPMPNIHPGHAYVPYYPVGIIQGEQIAALLAQYPSTMPPPIFYVYY